MGDRFLQGGSIWHRSYTGCGELPIFAAEFPGSEFYTFNPVIVCKKSNDPIASAAKAAVNFWMQTVVTMFGSEKKDKAMSKTSSQAAAGHSLNTFATGTEMEGKLKTTSDIRIDGNLKGELRCEAKVIIGPKGSIDGTVFCQNAVIEGKFNGTLEVKELLQIKESANVTGDVLYGKLVVQAGAVISGTYNLHGSGSNGQPTSSNQARKVVEESKK